MHPEHRALHQPDNQLPQALGMDAVGSRLLPGLASLCRAPGIIWDSPLPLAWQFLWTRQPLCHPKIPISTLSSEVWAQAREEPSDVTFLILSLAVLRCSVFCSHSFIIITWLFIVNFPCLNHSAVSVSWFYPDQYCVKCTLQKNDKEGLMLLIR